MPCCLVIAVLMFPRIILVCLFLLSSYLERAYHAMIVPLIGFFFLPTTTLAYAWLTNTHRPLEGANVLILILAVLIDAGGLGSGEYHRRKR